MQLFLIYKPHIDFYSEALHRVHLTENQVRNHFFTN